MAFDPIAFQSTSGFGTEWLSMLVYGPAGSGKTSLAKTTGALDKTLILAAEPGLLPLRGVAVKWTEIKSRDDLFGAIDWLERAGKAGKLAGRWIILDSVSEIAERLLVEFKRRPKIDPRQAYGMVQDDMIDAMKRCRDLPCNTVFVAKQERYEDAEQRIVYGPSLPGKKLAGASVYEFDLVLAMRVERGPSGVRRWLQTEADGRFEAKDRSGSLAPQEDPDLGAIAAKIRGSMRAPKPTESDTSEPQPEAKTDAEMGA